jgi:hypothetical protein
MNSTATPSHLTYSAKPGLDMPVNGSGQGPFSEDLRHPSRVDMRAMSYIPVDQVLCFHLF